MAIASRTVTINAAFLKEIKDDHRELWRLLADASGLAAEAENGEPHRRRFADRLAQLRDQLAMHFALEEAYGYFDDPLSVAPRLCGEAEHLRAQHATLYLELCRLTDEAERIVYQHAPLRESVALAEAFDEFHTELQEHEERENDLILAAFDDDLGVGD